MDSPVTGTQSGRFLREARSADAFASGVTISIAGEPFRATAEDAGRAGAMASLLGGFRRIESPVATPLTLRATAVTVPARDADFAVSDLEVWIEADSLVIRHDSGVVGEARSEAIVIGGEGRNERAFRRLLLPLVSYTLGGRGVYVLHGAAVASHAGALLVLGATGSGKSTVAGIALGAGWQVLGDDMFALRLVDGAPWVAGLPRPPAIPTDAFASPSTDEAPRDARGRIELDPGLLSPDPHPVAGTVIPRHRSAADVEAATAADPVTVLHTLVGSLPGAVEQVVAKGFMAVAAAVSRRPAWWLALDADPVRRRGDVAAYLDAVAGRRPDGRR